MSVIKRLIGRDPAPWSVGPPLFDILTSGVPDPDCVLPDVERQERFALSGMDRHALVEEIRNLWSASPVEPRSPTHAMVAAALRDLLALPDIAAEADGGPVRAAFYRLVRRRIDPPTMVILYGDLRDGRLGPAERARAEGLWLLRTASHRQALWFATAMLTACGQADDVNPLAVLMRHSAFQAGAIRAAAACLGDPMAAWERLHDRAGFLGRLNLVKLLIEHAAGRYDLKTWLLRNAAVACETPALVARDAAMAGGLSMALQADIVDAGLIDGACALIDIMLEQEHSDDGLSDGRLRDYPDAVDAVERLLHHLAEHTHSLRRLATVVAVKDWLHGIQDVSDAPGPEASDRAAVATDPAQDDLFGWRTGAVTVPEPDEASEDTPPSVNPKLGHGAWSRRGLTPERRRRLFVQCERIVTRPGWAMEIRRQHTEGDSDTSRLAWNLAERFRLDLWDATFARLEADPVNPALYRDLCDTRSPQRIERLLAVAASALPLIRIDAGVAVDPVDTGAANIPANDVSANNGPATVTAADGENGEGPASECLALLLKAMDRHKLMHAGLVRAALYGPSTRHRLAAVRVLSRHPWWQWGDDVEAALHDCLAREPDETIRETIYRAAVPGRGDGPARSGTGAPHRTGPLGMIRPFAGGRRGLMKVFRMSGGDGDPRESL